jgi:tricorn protease
MKKQWINAVLISFLMLNCFSDAWAIDPTDTRMMSQPAIGAGHIAFVYADDLWVANTDGSNPIRLTIDKGIESNPVFSPDGKLIAFNAEYDGNMDVFIIPVTGGVPKRLTYHPDADWVRGFTPDGKSVLFASSRQVFTRRYTQLFTVSVNGGFPVKLEIPNAWKASYSPDGKFMAYTPLGEAFNQWKNYRGGTISTIWLFSFADHSVVKILQPAEGCNDTDPIWIGNKIYFRSDRAGEFNLFSYDISSKEIKQLTDFKDFPILALDGRTDKIIFEQMAFLHIYEITTGTIKKLKLGISADLLELRPRFVTSPRYIRSASISPSGARAVFDYRGEIITVPVEKGDPRIITLTPGAHEKYPEWSPDGKYIAYFSDLSGEYELHLASPDGKDKPKIIRLNGTGFYAYLHWSPDSKKLAFVDNGRNLYILDIASSTIKKIDADEMYVPGPFRDLYGDWSPDSKWIVYNKVTETMFKRIYVYSLDQGKSFPLTDGLSDASNPVFDKGGNYLYFFASTDAGPVVNWFDQSNADMEMSYSIYLMTLRKDIISPFAKESDEETIKTEEAAKEPVKTDKKGKPDKTEPSKETKPFVIDFEGIQDRIVSIPLKADNYSQLGVLKENEIIYVSRPYDYSSTGKLFKYDIKKREEKQVMELNVYRLSADGKKMLYAKPGVWGITDAGEEPKAGKGILKVSDIQVKIDPIPEWKNIFEEAWRINRDYFYDPGMHGADWAAMKKKYEPFLAHLACRNDLNRLIQWMCSELAVGHHRLSGRGEILDEPKRIPGGLLGVDFQLSNGRYQFSKIYGGLNWNPDLRSPMTEPGINAKAGDYMLAVNGKDLTADQNIYSFFENTAGKIVELTIGPNPNYTGSRIVKVVPVGNESELRNRDWVEGNLKKVHEATSGQVAYVYVPNTAGAGHEYFKRYFFPQASKKAIIVDERFNGGGSLADYYIDILLRPYQAHWNFRYGKDLKSPSASIQGPKVMIIDETAGSGGDMLPYMFRKFKVGTLVGKRTWGGLVGILGFPEFIDGASVTAPNLAIWTKEGFIVENVGVAPDIEVEQEPALVIKGRDPQLEKAIELILKELANNPPVELQRPPYPIRVRK